MKISPRTDLLINVLLPLILGVLIYGTTDTLSIPRLVSNYLPDGLWAYSLLSAVLLIWKRKVVTGWIIAAFLLAVAFETGQYNHYLPGTGDLFDVLTYFLFFTLALILNLSYEKSSKTSSFI